MDKKDQDPHTKLQEMGIDRSESDEWDLNDAEDIEDDQ